MKKSNNIMTFLEYAEFIKEASKEQYARNVSYYDPSKGWVLDLGRVKSRDK